MTETGDKSCVNICYTFSLAEEPTLRSTTW